VIRILITAGAEPFAADAAFVQVREPQLEARALAVRVRAWMAAGASRVLVNDRADVAIACGAAGVHLRDGSIAPGRIRRIAPRGFVITVSCHDEEGVGRAEAQGADYAILAPIFAPLSKPATRLPLGLEALRSMASKTRIPVIALGGITPENARSCVEAGAAGVAGITLFRR
jgi:thiamine-phosphate pyrophosphorylase